MKEETLVEVVAKDDFVERGIRRISKETDETSLAKEPLSSLPSDEAIPGTSQVEVNSVPIAHEKAKEQDGQGQNK